MEARVCRLKADIQSPLNSEIRPVTSHEQQRIEISAAAKFQSELQHCKIAAEDQGTFTDWKKTDVSMGAESIR